MSENLVTINNGKFTSFLKQVSEFKDSEERPIYYEGCELRDRKQCQDQGLDIPNCGRCRFAEADHKKVRGAVESETLFRFKETYARDKSRMSIFRGKNKLIIVCNDGKANGFVRGVVLSSQRY